MAWVPYDNYLKKYLTLDNSIDHDDNASTTVKIAIVTSSYTPDRAAHDFWNDASTYEVSGANYTAGGNTLGNKTVTVNSNTVKFDSDDPATWAQSGSGFNNGRYAIMYKDTGTPSSSPLMAYYDLGSNKGNVDGDLTFQLDAAGIFTLAAA